MAVSLHLFITMFFYCYLVAGDLVWSGVSCLCPSRKCWLIGVCLLLLSIVFSWVLLTNTHWTVLPYAPDLSLGCTVSLAVLGAVTEEVFLRHYLQGRLRRLFRSDFVSIFVTACVFALMHTGVFDPVWIKWLQIFVLGICLGKIRVMLGLPACIAAHIVFNLAMLALGAHIKL